MLNDLKKILSNFFLPLLCLASIISCTSAPTNMPINTMKVIMWDMYTADEWYGEWQIKDSTAMKKKLNIGLYKTVLEKHAISKETFFKSYNYYLAHPLEMQILLDSVEAYGTRLKIAHQNKVPVK